MRKTISNFTKEKPFKNIANKLKLYSMIYIKKKLMTGVNCSSGFCEKSKKFGFY